MPVNLLSCLTGKPSLFNLRK